RAAGAGRVAGARAAAAPPRILRTAQSQRAAHAREREQRAAAGGDGDAGSGRGAHGRAGGGLRARAHPGRDGAGAVGAAEAARAVRTPPLDRVRAALARVRRVQEKRMFGGTTFMVNGKMCISVGKTRFMFRIDPEMHDDLVGKNGSRTVKMKGRAYRGFVHIDAP